MKQLFYIILTAIIGLASCQSSGKPSQDMEAIMKDSSNYTTLKWQDTAIDFGTKKMGGVVNLTFSCQNTGNKPLYLFDVRPSCGCTLVDYSKAPIAPGQSGKIEAKFDTKGHPGSIHKTIFVRTNSNDTSRYLTFIGTVLETDSTDSSNK